MIQAKSNSGEELVDFAFGVLRGEIDPTPGQLTALGWLSDRGYGKPLQSIELNTVISKESGEERARLPIERLSVTELETWNSLLHKLSAPAPEPPQPEPIKAKLLPPPSSDGGSEHDGEVK